MSDLYSQTDLRRILLAGVLILAADGSFDKREWSSCEDFLNRHWDPSYGEVKAMLKETIENLKALLSKGTSLEAKIRQVAEELRDSLNPTQRDGALNFLQEVIKADGELQPDEEKYFKIFFSILPPR